LPKRGVERIETSSEQPDRSVQVKLELPRDMGIQGIQHGNVDSPRAWILPHRQRTESLAQTIRKGSHEMGLGPHDFEGGQIGTPELTLHELEKLGALGGECGRKIRTSRDR
jgi:hypothetical protein